MFCNFFQNNLKWCIFASCLQVLKMELKKNTVESAEEDGSYLQDLVNLEWMDHHGDINESWRYNNCEQMYVLYKYLCKKRDEITGELKNEWIKKWNGKSYDDKIALIEALKKKNLHHIHFHNLKKMKLNLQFLDEIESMFVDISHFVHF